ncbi:PREDICTED: testis-expressed sequence 15 protein [Chrysochloris asiatica]|uniref:Testis-expressed sequence 15 protein n=1 Tax=Chrysochloris asiatica TaxID=185453 RepID=A0A9B0WIV0_CHRAS|nr:PREDICTED: testis-expressed sequence 15 protein [Chrysochloris asiatica]
MPSDTTENVSGDLLLNWTDLKNILSGFFPLHNNIGSSTVTTSKLIKDPRLTRREESIEKQNNKTSLNEIMAFEKSLDTGNSEINLSSMSASSVSSSEINADNHTVFTDCLDAPCYEIPFDDSQSQIHNKYYKDYDYAPQNKITVAGHCKEQDTFPFPISLSNVVSEVKHQKHSEENIQRSQQSINISPLLINQNNKQYNFYEPMDACTKDFRSHIFQESQSSNLKTMCQTDHQMSTISPLQEIGNIDTCIQNIDMRNHKTEPEDNSKHGEKHNLWKEIGHYFTNETKASPINNYISLHQECNEGGSSGENCGRILITQELEIAISSTSTTKSLCELDDLAVELQNSLSTSVESLLQNHPQNTSEYENNNIHTSFVVSQKQIELKRDKDQNCVSIITDALQEAKDISPSSELLIDRVLSSHGIETIHSDFNYNITKEHVWVRKENENELVSLEDNHKDSKGSPHIEDKGQDNPLFCDNIQQLNNATPLNIYLKEQENKNKANEEAIASSTEDNIENICGDGQQIFHTNKTFTNEDERRENENCNNVEIIISEQLSTTFNMTSNAEVQIASATIPEFTNHEAHQGYLFKEACSPESPDFGLLVKPRLLGCEIDKDKNILQDSFHEFIINENLAIQSLELENEIEIETEEYDDAFLCQQNTHCHGNVLSEELFEALTSRIDWEALFGSSNREAETLKNTTKRENTGQHYSEKNDCFYSSTQNTKAEHLNPVLLPDLQIRITNTFRPEFSHTADSHALKDNIYKGIIESTEPEINEEEKVPGLRIYCQSFGEIFDYPCEDKFDTITQESGLVSESETSPSFQLSQNIHMNHVSENQNGVSLFFESSRVETVNNGNSGSFSELKMDCNGTRSKTHMQPRISKRMLQTSLRDQDISHKALRSHEMYGKKRRLTSPDSYEYFSSLSQGRIKTFSRSEKDIRNVLNVLNSEASLCKSKRLSRKLDRAVLHLKKAHRRVHTSLQIIAKVGVKKKGPLPKSYAIMCNNFWESCDLEGYSSVYERKYSTKHFFPKRKDDKGEKRALEFHVNKSLTHVSKPKSYKRNGERITEHLSKKKVSSTVSRYHTTIHMKEFCGQEQHPESQLCLSSTSQNTSLSAYNSNMKLSGSSELQPFSGKTGCLFSPDHLNEKLPKKEIQIDENLLSNVCKYEKLENHSTQNITKERNFMASELTNKSSSVSLSCIKESVSVNSDRNCNETHVAHTEVETDVLISVSESDANHLLNVDLYKPITSSSDCKRNLEVNFPLEKCMAPLKSSKQNIFIRNLLADSLNPTLIATKKCNSIPRLFSSALVTNSEGKSSKSYLDKQTFFATSTTVSHYQQECGENEILKTEQCSSNNCFQIDGNDTDVTENSNLDLTSVMEGNKNDGENTMKSLFSNDGFLLLTDNIKHSSSQQCIAKKNIQDRKMWKVKQAEKTKDFIGDVCYKKHMTEESSLKTEDKNQRKNLEQEESCLSDTAIKNNMSESHLSIKNTPSSKALSVNNIVPHLFNKRKRDLKVKVNNESQSDSTVHSKRTYNFKPGIIGINHMPILHAHSETSEVTTHQKKPISYMNELKENHYPANYTGLVAKLSQILQRADEASSLQILQEETKVCENILPSLIEAFERNQGCSLEQILISRELLIQQNLWNNCRNKLKPCAIDSLVELQMMMETVQFIENKKRLLRDEPTFRSLLWYDETLYSELLGGPRGYQQQSNFYPAFQGRLKYNAFCELQKYHDQLIELFEETKREGNSYYAFLKYKRQIKECEAIMKHCSDCFDFTLSVPFTCGVNFGDSLGDLETLRKSTLELISVYRNSPKVHLYPGKQDHLWIIIEIISSKVNFIKSSEELSIKMSLYGLEHIFFDTAKSIVWEERRQSLKKYSRKKYKEMLLNINQEAFSELQKIYDTLSKDLSSEQIYSIGPDEDTMISCKTSDNLMNNATISIENYRFKSTLLSHPDICCISEILDQAEFADFKKLQELTLRCTSHLEILKKYFQMLQEDNIDNIFITEENALDMMNTHNHGAVILKPEAIEIYIEIVMVLETMHFLKNSMAIKQDKPRFRGMLWFDSSLLPELVNCQEKMANFSFLKDNSTDCLWKVIDTAISELKKDLDIIYKYDEAVNCSYALHLLSRELEEVSEIKKLLKNCKCSISTYINFVPCIASINYGSTLTELEYNYSQFSTLLKNIMASPRKDLGKMAHIMKVMKTIEHMKIICTKNAKLAISFILCQMLCNKKKASQLKKKGNMNIHIPKHGKSKNKPNTCMNVPSIPECIFKNISNSPKKRPVVDIYEDSQEQKKNTILTSFKKQKVDMKDVTKINKEKATFKPPRTTRSHSQSENKVRPSSSDSLKRNHVSPKKAEMTRSLPGSLLPFKDLKDTCTAKSENRIDLVSISSDISEDFTGKQRNLNSMKENMTFSTAAKKSNKKAYPFYEKYGQKSAANSFSKHRDTPSEKFLQISPDPAQKSCPSNIKPGTETAFLTETSVLSKPVFHFVKDTYTNLENKDHVLELQDNEMLSLSSENSTCANSSELLFIQNKIPALQVNEIQPEKFESEEKCMKDTLSPSTIPIGASENINLNLNQTAEYILSEQQSSENSKALTQNAAMHWNGLPQSACTPMYNSSQHSFGMSYPCYALCIYHYSNINGSSITQTYQGITSYEAQALPSGMLTTVASSVQNTHSNHFYSQYFGYVAEEPQTNDFMPMSRYFQSPMPTPPYNFQQPIFLQSASRQAAHPCPPNPGVLPEVPWIYAPWQQESFQPGH